MAILTNGQFWPILTNGHFDQWPFWPMAKFWQILAIFLMAKIGQNFAKIANFAN